jgi:hypothetical protein
MAVQKTKSSDTKAASDASQRDEAADALMQTYGDSA